MCDFIKNTATRTIKARGTKARSMIKLVKPDRLKSSCGVTQLKCGINASIDISTHEDAMRGGTDTSIIMRASEKVRLKKKQKRININENNTDVIMRQFINLAFTCSFLSTGRISDIQKVLPSRLKAV